MRPLTKKEYGELIDDYGPGVRSVFDQMGPKTDANGHTWVQVDDLCLSRCSRCGLRGLCTTGGNPPDLLYWPGEELPFEYNPTEPAKLKCSDELRDLLIVAGVLGE